MMTEDILTEAGVRPTPVRNIVLDYLYNAGIPLCHSEIAACLDLKHFDRVTIYRTLNTLKKAGLVHSVQGVDGEMRFCAHPPDHTGCPGNHPHFLCLKCGSMRCLTEQALPRVEVPEGILVKGKQFVVYGLCSKCAYIEEIEEIEEAEI